MAEKCTNTSSPVERWINPYPFAPLNHFTVPFSLTEKLLSLIIKNWFPGFPVSLPRPNQRTELPLKKSSRTRLRLVPQKYLPEKLPQSKRLPNSTTREEDAARTSGV